MDVVVIDTPQLGDRSYLVHDGTVGLVIDPQRDTQPRGKPPPVEAGVDHHPTSLKPTCTSTTSPAAWSWPRRTARKYLVNAADPVQFEREAITDGQAVRVGSLTREGSRHPGPHPHAPILHRGRRLQAGGLLRRQPALRFRGPDGPGCCGPTPLGLTHDQYASVRRLVAEARHDAQRCSGPTGFGSFCSSGPATGAGSSTVGEQLTANHALTDPDEDHFVQELIANLSAHPAYYAHMGAMNAKGPGPADLAVPESVDPAELTRRLEKDGEWVVDLRRRVAFASNHLKGSVQLRRRQRLQLHHLPGLGPALG